MVETAFISHTKESNYNPYIWLKYLRKPCTPMPAALKMWQNLSLHVMPLAHLYKRHVLLQKACDGVLCRNDAPCTRLDALGGRVVIAWTWSRIFAAPASWPGKPTRLECWEQGWLLQEGCNWTLEDRQPHLGDSPNLGDWGPDGPRDLWAVQPSQKQGVAFVCVVAERLR